MKFIIDGSIPSQEPVVGLKLTHYIDGSKLAAGVVAVVVVESDGKETPLVSISTDGSILRWMPSKTTAQRLGLKLGKDLCMFDVYGE